MIVADVDHHHQNRNAEGDHDDQNIHLDSQRRMAVFLYGSVFHCQCLCIHD